ncbi:hypothetical protein [Moheibacter lacus]|uniref:Uncharacterized protein n=1 Tax=Moheibacter lacus TaxID=2745851 RepID=A0A838ZP79_9FLAO|nr:hypothetical protein [Moheibacter lacus]MBA5629586.1 hypothetical protein [Moheibacter lacus]
MKIAIGIGLIFLAVSLGFGQRFQLVDSISIESRDSITDFEADDFHNVYYIRNFTELNKIDYQTRKRKIYSNQTVLENLNTQNILQITLKSALFNLLVLDNQLNQVQDLIEFPIETNFTPTLSALVDNNFLWGYDPVLQRLVLWNYRDKKAIRQSVILTEKTGDEFYSDLIYHQNKIYLIGFTKILRFDEYANLESVIPFQKFDQIYLQNDVFYYSDKGKLFQLDLKSKETKEISIHRSFDYFSVNNRFLFALKGRVVYLYEFQKNH